MVYVYKYEFIGSENLEYTSAHFWNLLADEFEYATEFLSAVNRALVPARCRGLAVTQSSNGGAAAGLAPPTRPDPRLPPVALRLKESNKIQFVV